MTIKEGGSELFEELEKETESEIGQIMDELEKLKNSDSEPVNHLHSGNGSGDDEGDSAEEMTKTIELPREVSRDASLEETLGDIRQDEIHQIESTSLLDQAASGGGGEPNVGAVVQAFPKSKPKMKSGGGGSQSSGQGSGALEMTLTGSMTLKLKYQFDGQEVYLGFENQCLVIRLLDGTEFKVPVHRKPIDSVA